MGRFDIPSLSATLLTTVVLIATATPGMAANGGIPVWQPTTITQPGNYVVTRDFDATGGTAALVISASNVTLDLNGKTITQTDPSVDVVEITATGAPGPVTIRNGTIAGGFTAVDATGTDLVVNLVDVNIIGPTSAGFRSVTLTTLFASGVHIDGGAFGIDLFGSVADSSNAQLQNVTILRTSDTAIRADNVTNLGASHVVISDTKNGFWLTGSPSPSTAKLAALIGQSNIRADVGIVVRDINLNVYNTTITCCEMGIYVTRASALFSELQIVGVVAGECFDAAGGTLHSALRLVDSPGSRVETSVIRGASDSSGDFNRHGVLVDNSDHVTITDTTVSGHGDDGIHVEASYVRVIASDIGSNGRHGIYVEGVGNVLEDNATTANGSDGLHFATGGHVMRGNLLLGNAAGIGGAGSANVTDGGGNIEE